MGPYAEAQAEIDDEARFVVGRKYGASDRKRKQTWLHVYPAEASNAARQL